MTTLDLAKLTFLMTNLYSSSLKDFGYLVTDSFSKESPYSFNDVLTICGASCYRSICGCHRAEV